MDDKDAERLAQAALRGFFGDAIGFKSMESAPRRAAVEAVAKLLKPSSEEPPRKTRYSSGVHDR